VVLPDLSGAHPTRLPARPPVRRSPVDLARELAKVADALAMADVHFQAEAEMNAALHMSPTIRPAPLAAAISTAHQELSRIISELEEETT
jgi:hypothetical protein